MNDLQAYFEQNNDRVIDKWMHYFEVYDRHFSRYRGKDLVLVEIGVFQGGSLQMWKNYFGDKVKVYGIDINPNCKQVEEENISILIGSQSDREFLRTVKQTIPPIDILIDDGGHTMRQQIVSFEELFDHVKPDGVYLCEDIHTSYNMHYGGGYKRKGTYIEYSKNFIDYLNAYHSTQKSLKVNSFTSSVNSLHYYDSMLIIEKRPTPKPYSKRTGAFTIPEPEKKVEGLALLKRNAKIKYRYIVNRLLLALRLPYPF